MNGTAMSKALKDWNHRDFVEDLAKAKQRTLVEVPLGAVLKNRGQVLRADVVEIKPSYTDFVVTIYEVKQRREDLLKSLREEKHQDYQEHCHRFYYACRKGIASPEEIPRGVGLCLRNENGWYTRRAGQIQRGHTIPRETMMALLFQNVKYQNSLDRRDRIAQSWRVAQSLQGMGKEVQDALAFYKHWGSSIEQAVEEVPDPKHLRTIISGLGELHDIYFDALEFYMKYHRVLAPLEKELSYWSSTSFLRREIKKLISEANGLETE